jgi:hypothetical protein
MRWRVTAAVLALGFAQCTHAQDHPVIPHRADPGAWTPGAVSGRVCHLSCIAGADAELRMHWVWIRSFTRGRCGAVVCLQRTGRRRWRMGG